MAAWLALALLLAVEPTQYDTVVLANGGVLRGTVVKDLPGEALVLQLPDGALWTVPRAEVTRVDYATTLAVPPPGPLPDAGMEPPPPEEGLPGPSEARVADLAVVNPLAIGVGVGLAAPLGRLDASGLGLASAVSLQFNAWIEISYRPIDPLELGIATIIGGGTSYPPLNDYCLAAGAWCDTVDLYLGFFPRWSFLPHGPINPWVMVSGGIEWMSVSNQYQDAFDYTGWLVGGAVGIDLRITPGFSTSFFLGTRWGQFTALSVTGYLPILPFQPAWHGWLDLGFRVNWAI